MSTLTGTPIPASGYVEKVYFNTDLSVEEVVAILEEAYIEPGVMDIMECILWSDSYGIDVFSGGGDFTIVLSSETEDPIAIFDSADNSYYGFTGWNPDITYPLVINSNIEGNEKNEMLSNLCSITPFKEEPVIPEEPFTLNSLLKGVADAIREKKGTTEKINPKNYKSEIRSIDTGVDTSDATAVESDILKGKTAYVNGKKITGKITTYTLEPPSIVVNHGTILATTMLQGGYYSKGSKTATMDLTTIHTTTYTPGRYDQTIAEDTYLAGDQIIKGDYNLVPENIKKDVSIFGVTGTYDSVSINGMIEEYKVFAGATVNAGDFVEFVNSSTNNYQQLNTTSNSCNYAPSCILLDDNRVFIAHSYGSDNYLYGTIVEINGDTITATSAQLNSKLNSCEEAPSCILLEENKVFITHVGLNDDSDMQTKNYLAGTIVQINGTTMTATTTQLLTDICISFAPSCILLENNKIFIAYSRGIAHMIWGAIVEINGTDMTITEADGSFCQDSMYCCETQPTCLLLENNKVLISYSAPDMNTATRITIVEIDGTTMTATTKVEGFPYANSNCILLENNKVFIAYRDTWGSMLCGGIAEIDGTEVTVTMTELCLDESNCMYTPSCVLLEDNKVLVVHSYGEENYLYKTVVDINGTEMTATTTAINSTANICNNTTSCLSLDANNIFIAHVDGADNKLSATIASEGTYAKPYEIAINGIAKTGGATGETVEVYIPY